MSRHQKSRIFAVIVGSIILLWGANADSTCTLASDTTINKKYFDKLQPIVGQIFTATDANNTYTYRVGICADVSEDKKSGAAAEQVEIGGSKHRHVLGTTKNILVTGGVHFIMVEYYNGDPYTTHCNNNSRQSTIMLVCDENEEKGKLTVLEENTDSDLKDCYYLFELATRVACVPKGMSGLEIFLLIFLVGVLVYFLIGFLYQRIVVGAQSLEQIPNYNMWKEFGKLVADGCDYMCRCGDRHEAKMYRSIDENLPPAIDREDRDDSMLNL